MPRHFSIDTNTASDDAVPFAKTIALDPCVATKSAESAKLVLAMAGIC